MGTSNENGNSLEDRVLEWLKSEGYPLEFYTAHMFQKNGFVVRQGRYVRDIQSDSPREIDVIADVNKRLGDSFIRISHVVECKWSKDKPWVIFTSKSRISPSACVAQTIGSEVGQAILWTLAGDNNLHSLDAFFTPTTPGFNGRQVFGKGNDTFYGTMQAVISAAISLAESYNRPYYSLQDTLQSAVIIFPIIVIDGKLFEVAFKENTNQLTINETDRARIHWRGAEVWNVNATIDLVTADKLDDFVAKRMLDVPVMLDRMTECFEQIKDCLAKQSLEPLHITKGGRGVKGVPPLLAKLRAMIVEKKLEQSEKTVDDNDISSSN